MSTNNTTQLHKPTPQTIASRKYYQTHKQQILAQQKQYRQQNRDIIQQKRRDYYNRNKIQIQARRKIKQAQYVLRELYIIEKHNQGLM